MPSVVRVSDELQRGSWQFDIRSALIGALLAWILAALVYSQRRALRQVVENLWQPIAAWRRRMQASQEEKYVRALKGKLRHLLLFEPENPALILQEPTFVAPAALPTSIAEVAQSPRLVTVPYTALLDGHRKVVLVGAQGSGRTSALILTVWRVTEKEDEDEPRPYARLPLWGDLANLSKLAPKAKATAADRLGDLLALGAPGAAPGWLLQHLRREPCLVLLDNWEQLSLDDRDQVAQWIAEADAEFDDVFWVVASGSEGYGCLVEHGFVPAQLTPQTEVDVPALVAGWCQLLGIEADTPDDEILDALRHAASAQAPLWELHLRTILYTMTNACPERPVEVVQHFIDSSLGTLDLGKGQETIADQAQELAFQALVKIAGIERLEARAVTDQEARDIVEALLPPKEERPRRLDGAVRKLIVESGFLHEESHRWRLQHPVWRDYLAAVHLAQAEDGEEVVLAHVQDESWAMLAEFYAGLYDAETIAQVLINQVEAYGDRQALRRAVRWGIVADPSAAWRKTLLKLVAQTFMRDDLDDEARIEVGRMLALVAGEGARAFFVRMLRYPSPPVQRVALRGLGWVGSTRDMPIMAAALRDSDAALQESAVRALRDLGTPGAATYLSESLANASETLMPVITEALAAMPDGWQALSEAARHPDILVRRAVAYGLGRIDEDWAIQQLLEMAREDPQWLVRSAADSVLQAKEEQADHHAKIAGPPDVEQLDWLIAWAARQGVGLGVGQAALDMLGRAAQEGNVDAKVLSALTLAQIGREDDLRILEPLLSDPGPEVQQAADWAIQRIRQRYQVPTGL